MVMTREFNPWDPNAMAAEPTPIASLVEETRAALEQPGARVEDIKRRYHEARKRGLEHLDPPMTLDAAVAALEVEDAEEAAADYDDGPFAEGPKVSPFQRKPRPRVRRPRPSTTPPTTAASTWRRLFGSGS